MVNAKPQPSGGLILIKSTPSKLVIFHIAILWQNSKANTILIEISNTQKPYIENFLAITKFYMMISPKPYIQTLMWKISKH